MTDFAALAAQIAQRGTTHSFGIPGGGASLELIDALEQNGVAFHTTCFEGSAALMAGAFGRQSGRAGVAIGIKGPGLSNMVPGLAACRLESMPVVAITEAYPPGTPLGKSHKRLDHDCLVSGVAKGRRSISAQGPGFTQLAEWAEAEQPSPVLLDIFNPPLAEDAPVPDATPAKQNSKLIDLVLRSQRPVVIAGTLAIRRGWSGSLNALAIPVFSTAAAKGVVDETLPQAAGVYTGAGLDLSPERTLFHEADLIIGLGLRSNEVLVSGALPTDAINIDSCGVAMSPGFNFAASGEAADMNDFFSALCGKAWGLDLVASAVAHTRQYLLGSTFLPAHMFQYLETQFNYRARLVLDTGAFCTVGEHIGRVRHPHLYLSSGQGRYMGISLPLAIGAAFQDPSTPTLLAVGDGGIGMFIGEAKLAAENRLPLLIVMLSDGGFGCIRPRAETLGLSTRSLTMKSNPWRSVMDGLGFRTWSAKTESDVVACLESWDPAQGPAYLEVSFKADPYANMCLKLRS